MSEIILPRWSSRHDVARADQTRDFYDIAGIMVNNFNFYELIYNVVAPYEARQRDTDEMGNRLSPYVPPTPDFLRGNIRRPSFISETVYDAAIRGIVTWCAENKGLFALPVPHPTTIHSIQLPLGSFSFTKRGAVHVLQLHACKAEFIIQRLKNIKNIKHVILRPRSSSSGAADISNWELLTFEEEHGYIPLWVDSTANPRFAGTI